MKVLKAVDAYFIGNAEEGTIEDRLWFYGTYVVAIVITITIGMGGI